MFIPLLEIIAIILPASKIGLHYLMIFMYSERQAWLLFKAIKCISVLSLSIKLIFCVLLFYFQQS